MVMTMISVGISCLVTNLCLAKASCDQPFGYSVFTFLNIRKLKKLWVSQIIPLNLMQQWWQNFVMKANG
ncbi:Uncharacterised protein [Mycobacteroides abscessus subsp. abscessus]|nr:Uncharacterised protein [Mycobacteroides abscessus subsp. abscessus]